MVLPHPREFLVERVSESVMGFVLNSESSMHAKYAVGDLHTLSERYWGYWVKTHPDRVHHAASAEALRVRLHDQGHTSITLLRDVAEADKHGILTTGKKYRRVSSPAQTNLNAGRGAIITTCDDGTEVELLQQVKEAFKVWVTLIRANDVADGHSGVYARPKGQPPVFTDPDDWRLTRPYRCPTCGSPLATLGEAFADEEHKHSAEVESFECGLVRFGGRIESPCPSDPNFPGLEEYHLRTEKRGPPEYWLCRADPITPNAKKLSLHSVQERTEDAARARMAEQYARRARRWTG